MYGGSGLSFVSSVIAIEELAKIDPAVSVMVDVQVILPLFVHQKLSFAPPPIPAPSPITIEHTSKHSNT